MGVLQVWSYTLSGLVRDKDTGEPIEFATVELAPGLVTVVTDSHGHYSVSADGGLIQ